MAAERQMRITYFLEDIAHERFIPPLVERLARELQIAFERVDVRGRTSSYSRGSRIVSDFKRFLHDAQQTMETDLIVICIDGNCVGHQEKRRQLQDECDKAHFAKPVIFAIPDPHIEYWYLCDRVALCQALDVKKLDIQIPKAKCERDLYKHLLEEACDLAEISTTQRGIEYGPGIATHLNLLQTARSHPAFKAFYEDARQKLQEIWRVVSQA